MRRRLDDLEVEDEDTAKEVSELHELLEQFPKDCSEYSEAMDLVEEVERTQEEWDDKKKEYRDKLMKNLEKQQELERLEKDMVKEADKIDEHLDHIELLLGKTSGDDPFGTAEADASTTEAREELEKVKNRVKDLKEKQEQLVAENKVEEVRRHPVKPIEDRVNSLEAILSGKEDELDAINKHTAECNEALKAYDELANDVQQYVEDAGFSVVRTYVGHGVGRELHEDPEVPNFGTAGRGPRLVNGMVLAIEPMVNEKSHVVKTMSDGWTTKTVDGGLAAHFEHTIAITPNGPVILTQPRRV